MVEKIEVFSPFNGEKVGEVPKHSWAETEKMLETAYSLYKDKSKWLSSYDRVAILEKLAKLLEEQVEDFAITIAKEGGKPYKDAKIEAIRAVDGVKLAIKELPNVMRGEEISMGYTLSSINRLAFTTYEPIGVVVAISAFNHPLNLIIHQVVPAIAVGAPVIVKPAKKTPISCYKFVELVKKAGLPEGWCNFVCCETQDAEKLAIDPRVDFFTFIGSAKVGWGLRSKLAPGTRCSFEHGGLAAAVIDKNLDSLDKIIEPMVKGSFYHAGQVCISTQRIFVHESMLNDFSNKFVEASKKLIVGDPTNHNTDVGPLISTNEVDRVDTWVKDAISSGAKLLLGGNKLSNTTYAVTILQNPALDANVSCKEVFGPVVSIYSYKDLDEAIEKVNKNSNLPFQSAIFSNNINNIMKLYKGIDASAIIVNDHTAFRIDSMPFAGRKEAGHGIGGIKYTMHDMINHKMVVINNN